MSRSPDTRAGLHGPTSGGMAQLAVAGTGWATGQALAGKLVTLVATWVIARNLSSAEVAVATLASTVTKFLCVLPPLNMGDLLIAHRRSLAWLQPIASRMGLRWGVGITVVSMLLAPLVARYYSNFPTTLLTVLLMVTALRPFAESMQVIPLTGLRLAFRNRTIALVDGTVQLVAAAATIVLAVCGAGAWAMVAPLSGAFALRALGYRVARGPRGTEDSPQFHGHSEVAGRLVRNRFITAGGAQYVHSLIDTMPMLVLAKLSSEQQTGFFGFAFTLAAQANTMIAAQIAGVLQPVLGHLGQDPSRQTGGYLRAMRMLGAVAVPICLCQAAYSETLFAVFVQGDLQQAAGSFAALSLSEAFYFASAPTMAMLRAQGRFGTFLGWQVIHLVAAMAILPVAAIWGGGTAVAAAVAGLWSVSLPMAVWVTTRPTGGTLWKAARIFLAPWLTGLPLAGASWWITRHFADASLPTQTALLLVGGPLSFAIMLAATRWTQPDAFAEMWSIASRLVHRVLRRS